MDEPQRPDTGNRHNEIQNGAGDSAHIRKGAAGSHIEIACDPLEHQKPEGGGHQQLAGAGADELLVGLLFQCIAGADARHDKEQHHEPGVDKIQRGILILDVVKSADAAQNAGGVEYIEYVIDQYQQHSAPADVVQIGFSHFSSSSSSRILDMNSVNADLGGMAIPFF